MNLEEILLNDELVIGEDCYFYHDKYTYNGLNEEGKHILTKVTKDGEANKYISDKPFRPKLPLHLYFKNKRTRYLAELTEYTQMLGKMYYKLTIYEDVFKGYTHENFDELFKNWDLLDGDPFAEETALTEQINEFNFEIREYEKQIQEIKDKHIKPIEEKREELYKYCKHDWYKYDEEEVSKNYYEQQCECQICGKVKYSRYNKWN